MQTNLRTDAPPFSAGSKDAELDPRRQFFLNVLHARGHVCYDLLAVGAEQHHDHAAHGFALAFSYRMRPIARVAFSAMGLILAVLLHTAFNALMMMGSGTQSLSAFFLVWSAAVVFFALFEILKYYRYRRLPKNVC